MNDRQRDALKQLMRTRINEIEGFLSPTGENSDLDDESANLDQKIASAVSSQVSQNEKRELALIRNNLQWLDSEDAGYCHQCSGEIPFARLQAVPATRLCIGCAERS
ncbi:MAG: TraR/DksA family transcriptional regulator [Pseudomonadales bacterium]|nr:TraR/DksA family transcriptional regulator [Pseudomonadales bacterium]